MTQTPTAPLVKTQNLDYTGRSFIGCTLRRNIERVVIRTRTADVRNEYSATVAPPSTAFLKATYEKTAMNEKTTIEITEMSILSFGGCSFYSI